MGDAVRVSIIVGKKASFDSDKFHSTRDSSPSSMASSAHDKVDELAERNADTTESDIRYLAYGARLRTALRAATRYVAYVRVSLFRCSFTHSRNHRRVTSGRRSAQ